MTLEPVTEGRHPVRVTAPTVTTPRPGVASPTRDPRTAAEHRLLVERRTRIGLRLGYVALRTLAVAGLVLIAYLTVTQGWIGAATDAFLGWYTTTVAPYLAIDPLAPQLPVGDGSLFGTVTTPSFVISD
ncbi:hypothetical protein [Demequina muriae]|uniref:Uncharacterized protein n=1 Tax=Demequina muriae TaxID=3051664 RepID=A0ABT8GE28_9MICO|nr:hypothetical protein [Demequina sp. EGI L300058]MDN4479672.1 hypothetical protein [Demequina sp. EGI L300058]